MIFRGSSAVFLKVGFMSDDTLSGYSEEEQKKRRIAIDLYRRGNEALAKGNFDYAVDCYKKCVQLVPDHLHYRQVIRGAVGKKYRDNKTGASMAFLRVAGVKAQIKKLQFQKKWRELDAAAEDGLLINPWDASFNAGVGEAAVHLNYPEVAIFGYEKAVESDPKNKDYLRALAHGYEKKLRYLEAIKIWERVQQLDPLDIEARSKITGLNATNMIQRANLDETTKMQDVVINKQGYEASIKGDAGNEEDTSSPGQSLENDLRHAIRREPAAIGNYLKLAELYRKELRFDEACDIYQKALQVSGGDPNVRERLEDVQLEMGRRNRDLVKQDAAKHPSDAERQQRFQDVNKELIQQEITVYSSRVERYPQDLRLKAELANRFVLTGKTSLAIPLYQQAAKDPRLEALILVSLGKCFLKEKKNDLAEFQFKKAVVKLNPQDHLKVLLECRYYLGRLSEEAMRTEDAISNYNEVIALEYDYKDARERLEKLQGHRPEERGGLGDEV